MIDEGDIPSALKNDVQGDTIETVLSIVFGVAAAVAVLIITLAALKIIMSKGNPQDVAKARDAIVYASIGLVVSLAAYTIVRYVIGAV
ncbi:hypothetical protein KC867_01865 [Candidatus Saccharibacteria bacterium]|nr:hypothetical protein [Candidatus Saccharibacteria bacterium]